MATRYHTGQNPVQDRVGAVRVASGLADWDSIGKKSVGVVSRGRETGVTLALG
ncbi:MAG: hypothetical protein ACREI2_04155 [Nitrospiraceae bacterium]